MASTRDRPAREGPSVDSKRLPIWGEVRAELRPKGEWLPCRRATRFYRVPGSRVKGRWGIWGRAHCMAEFEREESGCQSFNYLTTVHCWEIEKQKRSRRAAQQQQQKQEQQRQRKQEQQQQQQQQLNSSNSSNSSRMNKKRIR